MKTKITFKLFAILISAGLFHATQAAEAYSLDKLPVELVDIIARYVGDKDASNLARANKNMRTIVEGLRSLGKLHYPTFTFHAMSDFLAHRYVAYISRVIPTFELVNKLKSTDLSHVRGVTLVSKNGRYVPSQLTLLKNVKHLSLHMPNMIKDLSELDKAQKWSIYSETGALNGLTQTIKLQGFQNTLDELYAGTPESVISLDELINQLPALERLTLTDDTQKKYDFKGAEELQMIKKTLAALSADEHTHTLSTILKTKHALEHLEM